MAQLVARQVHTLEVGGSSPSPATTSLLDSSVGQSGGIISRRSQVQLLLEQPFAGLAQLVEQRPCNAQVVRSNRTAGTKNRSEFLPLESTMTTNNVTLATDDPFMAISQDMFSDYSRVYQLLAQTSQEARTRLVVALKRLRSEMGIKAFRPSWNMEAIRNQSDAEKAVTHLADVLEQELAGTLETWHIKTHSITVNGKTLSRGFYYHKNGLPVFDEAGMHKQHGSDHPEHPLPAHLVAQLRAVGATH